MSHKNNHETTRLALREEVQRSLENALPSNVPEKTKRETVDRFERLFEQYSSPYPDPNFLAQIEKMAPGSAAKIITATQDELRHRQIMDLREADQKERDTNLVRDIANAEISSVREGRWLGFLAYIICVIFSGSMYLAGSEKLAYAAFSLAAIGVIAQLIRGGRSGVSIIHSWPPEDNEPSPLRDGETSRKKLPAKK